MSPLFSPPMNTRGGTRSTEFREFNERPGSGRETKIDVVPFNIFNATTDRLLVEIVSLVVAFGPDWLINSQSQTDGIFGAFYDRREGFGRSSHHQMDVPNLNGESVLSLFESRRERLADKLSDCQ